MFNNLRILECPGQILEMGIQMEIQISSWIQGPTVRDLTECRSTIYDQDGNPRLSESAAHAEASSKEDRLKL